MAMYDVAIDIAGTVHYDIEASSADEAYEKAKSIFDKCKSVDTGWIYEANYYVEDEKGYQHEY